MAGHLRRLSEDSYRLVVSAGFDPGTGRRRRVQPTFRRKPGWDDERFEREATRALNRLVVEVEDGRHIDSGATLGALLDQWLERKRSLAPGTREDYERVVDSIKANDLGRLPLRKITPQRLDTYYDTLPFGAARVRRYHHVLSQSLGLARRWGWINSNPALEAEPPVVRRRKPEAPKVEEVAALLAAADPMMRAYLYIASHVGARRSELCALRWADFDAKKATLTIRRAFVQVKGKLLVEPTKTDDVRVLALDERRVQILEALGPGEADDYIFTIEGRPWQPSFASKRFAKLRDACGLPHVRLRNIRHFVATEMLSTLGVDPVTVSARLGHKRTSTTTDFYGARRSEADRDASDRLGRLLG